MIHEMKRQFQAGTHRGEKSLREYLDGKVKKRQAVVVNHGYSPMDAWVYHYNAASVAFCSIGEEDFGTGTLHLRVCAEDKRKGEALVAELEKIALKG